MDNIDKFIGIPFVFGTSSFKSCDCIGLCRLFYKEHGWSDTFWDNGEKITEDALACASTWKRLYRYCRKNMDKRAYGELSFGDFVVFCIAGDLHTGIYLSYGNLLSMQVPTIEGKSFSTIYHRDWWKPFFKYGFHRRDNT